MTSPQLESEGRLVHQHAQATLGAGASHLRCFQPRCPKRPIDEVNSDLTCVEQPAVAVAVPDMPTGVALMTRSNSGASTGSAGRPTSPASDAADLAASDALATTATSRAPWEPKNAITDRDAPPAPAIKTRSPSGDKPMVRRNEAKSPAPSVEVPVVTPSSTLIALTLLVMAADESRTSTRPAISALSGIVTETPRSPRVEIAARTLAPPPAPTSNRAEAQLRPIASKAAWWSSGEREWAIGEPTTPTNRSGVGRTVTPRCSPRASRWPAVRRRWSRIPSSQSCRST